MLRDYCLHLTGISVFVFKFRDNEPLFFHSFENGRHCGQRSPSSRPVFWFAIRDLCFYNWRFGFAEFRSPWAGEVSGLCQTATATLATLEILSNI